MRYLRFFFGSPRRLLASTVTLAIAVLVEQVAPGTIGAGLAAVGASVLMTVVVLLEQFLAPIAWAVLPLIIVVIGFRIMMRGFGGGKRK